MAGVRVPEPVRAKVISQSRTLRRSSQDYAHAAAIEVRIAQ